jgi:transposase
MSKKRSYNREFKEEAIRLAEKSRSTQAHDLGILRDMIYLRKRQMAKDADKAFPGKEKLMDPELAN